MLYQPKVSQRMKEYKGIILPRSAQPEPILLRPTVSIKDIAYWQKRAGELLPGCVATCQVAK
jgi:hypothetical protein